MREAIDNMSDVPNQTPKINGVLLYDENPEMIRPRRPSQILQGPTN